MTDDNDTDLSDRYMLPALARMNRERQQRRYETAGLILLPAIVLALFCYAACIILGVIK